jgi:hypothetical protein
MKPDPGCRLWNVEPFRDLSMRPALLVSEQDEQPLAVAQPLQRAGHVEADHGSVGLVKRLLVGNP